MFFISFKENMIGSSVGVDVSLTAVQWAKMRTSFSQAIWLCVRARFARWIVSFLICHETMHENIDRHGVNLHEHISNEVRHDHDKKRWTNSRIQFFTIFSFNRKVR